MSSKRGGRTPDIAFVVASSGPGVTPGAQERYARRTYLIGAGVLGTDLSAALELYDELMNALRRGATFADVRPLLAPHVYQERGLVLFPDDQEFWGFFRKVFDYEPRRPLERIRVPVLALFGADDPLVPVPQERRRLPQSPPT